MKNHPSCLASRIALCVLTSALLCSCFLLPDEEEIVAPPLMEAPEITYDTMRVVRDTVENKISVYGTLEYTRQFTIYFKNVTGKLLDIYALTGDAVKKGQLLVELDSGNLETQIEKQELQVRKAQLSYERLIQTEADKFQREMAEIDLELQEITLRDLKRDMDSLRLYSPIDGVVTYRHMLKSGETVPANQTILTVAEPSSIQLVSRSAESSKFAVGMITTIRYKTDTFRGLVVSTPTNAPEDAPANLKDAVIAKVLDPIKDSYSGMSLLMEITLQKAENVIAIPANLVRTYLGSKYVYVLENGLKKEKPVETGIAGSTMVEITKGLDEGELLITR